MAHHGVPYDAFRSTFRVPAGREMLVRYGLNHSCTFALSKYGEALARCLAQYWVQEMSFFFLVWDSHGRGAYEFSEADRARWVEPPAFVAAYVESAPAQQVRMQELRALRPGRAISWMIFQRMCKGFRKRESCSEVDCEVWREIGDQKL